VERYEPKERPEVTRLTGGPGEAGMTIESLPAFKDDAEFAILEKFIAGMSHFQGRDISGDWSKPDRWPDFERGDGADAIGIELARVVHQHQERFRDVQNRYARRVAEGVASKIPDQSLAGLAFQLDDGYQEPPYPSLSSNGGYAVANVIADLICSNVEALSALPLWIDPERTPPVAVARADGPGGVRIGYVAHRYAAADSGQQPTFRFFGSFPMDSAVYQSQVRRTVEQKLKKDYGTYEGHLWLVVYGLDFFSEDAEMDVTASVLSTASHPFDQVWLMYPVPGKELGDVRLIWPQRVSG
jgi:hypothetical protein